MVEAARKDDNQEFAEEHDSLWRLTLGPSAWALHFVICYAAAAVVCAKVPDPSAVAGLRLGLGALTVLALAVISWLGVRAWREWNYFGDRHNEDKPDEAENRHQFINHAAFLLVVVSFIGVIFVSLPIIYLGSCR